MDPDVNTLIDYFGHLFPDFSTSHFTVYKLLWRVEPLPVEKVISQTGLSKTTTYTILRDLAIHGLINKTNFSPIGYYATNPIKAYKIHLKKIKSKLKKGKQKLAHLIKNSTSLSGELFLIKREGGQQKLIIKKTRTEISKITQLLEIKKAAEEQLKELDKQKLKTIAIYK